jgi:hypothetical protein
MHPTKVVFTDSDGKALDMLSLERRGESNPFKSGSIGFYAGGKVLIDGVRYQVSCSIVEVGTKGKF